MGIGKCGRRREGLQPGVFLAWWRRRRPGTVVRYWDFAATAKETADWTVGVRMRRHEGIYYIEDVRRERVGPGEVDHLVYNTAQQDGTAVQIG